MFGNEQNFKQQQQKLMCDENVDSSSTEEDSKQQIQFTDPDEFISKFSQKQNLFESPQQQEKQNLFANLEKQKLPQIPIGIKLQQQTQQQQQQQNYNNDKFPDFSQNQQIKYQDQIQKMQFKKLAGMQLKFPNIFPTSFIALIVGKPDSGKSFLIAQLLTHQDIYFQKFHKVFYVAASPISNLPLQESTNWNRSLDVTWIFSKLKECVTDAQKLKERNVEMQILFVFDDVVSELNKQQNENFVQQLFINRRHLIPNATISHFITTQKFNLCPLKLRTQCNALFYFNISNNEWESIKKEVYIKDSKQLKQIMDQIFGKNDKALSLQEQQQKQLELKGNFIYINMTNNTVYNKFKEIQFFSPEALLY